MPPAPKKAAGSLKPLKRPLKVEKTPTAKSPDRKIKSPFFTNKKSAGKEGVVKQLTVAEIQEQRKKVIEQLQQVEKQIYALEEEYIVRANPQGNALKGYQGLLSVAVTQKKQAQRLEDKDRIFSGSSVTGQLAGPGPSK